MELDMLSTTKEQLEVLVPYLERAATEENPEPLTVTTSSYTLVARVLSGWGGLVVPGRPAITTKGAFLYYLKLVGKKSKGGK